MYCELTRSQQPQTVKTETKRLAGCEKAAISLTNILTLGRKTPTFSVVLFLYNISNRLEVTEVHLQCAVF